jgi:hypothetical protein
MDHHECKEIIMGNDKIRQTLLEIEEIKLKAQLRAVREALKGEKKPIPEGAKNRMSHVEYVFQVLKNEKIPLHVTTIIERCKDKFGVELSRESIVSALLKKVNRMDRFIKTDRNTFGLSEYRELYCTQNK